MRIFALSDVHVDYESNARWVEDVSSADYQQDVLILAGDVAHTRRLLDWCLRKLAQRFKMVLFVPGNHDLWVIRDDAGKNSLQKFEEVQGIVAASGASMSVYRERGLSIIPLLSWYDYSFGEPSDELRSTWMDFLACRWPSGLTERDVAGHFAAMNGGVRWGTGDKVITYSHFLPRIDLMPGFIPNSRRLLYPILGSAHLDRQLRTFSPSMHVYGHSHVNRRTEIDGVDYINNAFGYPSETRITAKRLLCIHEC
jgi:predicted phosphodiesterase